MRFLIMYEFVSNGITRFEYTIVEHENKETALAVFKQQNPYLKPMCIRELHDSLYI